MAEETVCDKAHWHVCVWGDRKLPYAEGQLLAPWNPGMQDRLVWGTLLKATLPWTP